MDIHKFLDAPADARKKANDAFVAYEPSRSRALFDRIESRPFTEEQRRAVVLDERRTQSCPRGRRQRQYFGHRGQGRLTHREQIPVPVGAVAAGFRPRRPQGDGGKNPQAPRTSRVAPHHRSHVHSLGMSIIGQAEGRRPQLARASESDGALFKLFKDIIEELLVARLLSSRLPEWFRDRFAPYKSEHESSTAKTTSGTWSGSPDPRRKTVRPMRKSEGPTVHVGLPGQEGLSLLKEAFDGVASDAANCDGKSHVLILGRYRHLKPRNMGQPARQYPRPRFSYMTVHRSKGLDADHVVALGLRAGKHGFPAGIADDPLLDLVLAAPGAYPNAGERRLLYAAITRARRLVHLLADRGPPSAFARELIEDDYGEDQSLNYPLSL